MRTAIVILAFSTLGIAATPTKADLDRAIEQIERIHAIAEEGEQMLDEHSKKALSIEEKIDFDQARTIVEYFNDFFAFNGCERRFMVIELEARGHGLAGETATNGRTVIEDFIRDRAQMIIGLATVYQNHRGVPADFKSYYKKVLGQCQAVATRIDGLLGTSVGTKASSAP